MVGTRPMAKGQDKAKGHMHCVVDNKAGHNNALGGVDNKARNTEALCGVENKARHTSVLCHSLVVWTTRQDTLTYSVVRTTRQGTITYFVVDDQGPKRVHDQAATGPLDLVTGEVAGGAHASLGPNPHLAATHTRNVAGATARKP
jgi:hypothetical protein